MKEFESVIIEKNIQMTKLEAELEAVKHFKITNESLKKQLNKREEEIGVLRAKLFLDMYSLNIKIVPEYPDMVEENRDL
jgi:hypothetical protein